MAKKAYQSPETEALRIDALQMVCASKVAGIDDTADFETGIDDGQTTDTYLSRRRSLWDDEELDDDEF